MMNELYDLCDNLKDEIKELTKKGDISPTELDRAYKAVDIIKDIKTIEAMQEAGNSNAGGSYAGGSYNSYNSYERGGNSREGGQSNRMPYPYYYYDEPGMSNERGGNSRDGRYSEDGGSYRRGRDAMGRYTSRDGGYSGHEEKEQMMRQIEEMKRKVQQMQ